MIKLMTQAYCDKCPEFEAEVKKHIFKRNDNFREADVFVYCKNSDRCARLVNFLKTNGGELKI